MSLMNQTLPPFMQLANLSREYVLSRSIQAIANLGIADVMGEDPIPIEDIAQKTGTMPDLLDRILHFLSNYGLFKKTEKGYALTTLSYPLRSDDPHSIRSILGMVDSAWWEAFAHLEEGLQSGIPAFNLAHRMPFFDYQSQTPAAFYTFSKGMDVLCKQDEKALIEAYSFSKLESLVDVTYERETFVQNLSHHTPMTELSTFHLSAETVTHLQHTLFNDLPKTNAVLFKGILHDFNDAALSNLLSCLEKKQQPNDTLLIAEQVIPKEEGPHTNKTMDIIMMVLVGGKQRTQQDWINLVQSHPYTFIRSYPTHSLFTLMEFKKNEHPIT